MSRASAGIVSHIRTCPPRRFVAYAILTFVLVIIVCTTCMRTRREPFYLMSQSITTTTPSDPNKRCNVYLNGSCSSQTASGRDFETCNHYEFLKPVVIDDTLHMANEQKLIVGGKSFKQILQELTQEMQSQVNSAEATFQSQASVAKQSMTQALSDATKAGNIAKVAESGAQEEIALTKANAKKQISAMNTKALQQVAIAKQKAQNSIVAANKSAQSEIDEANNRADVQIRAAIQEAQQAEAAQVKRDDQTYAAQYASSHSVVGLQSDSSLTQSSANAGGGPSSSSSSSSSSPSSATTPTLASASSPIEGFCF
jgi:hypothetical protein